MLEDEGIVITTAAAVDIEKILANTDLDKLEKISDLKYSLAPLLCRNKEDQDKVYKVFDKLDEKIGEVYISPGIKNDDEILVKPVPVKPVDTPQKKWYLKKLATPALIILGLLLVGGLLWIPGEPEPVSDHKINIVTTPQQVLTGDTVHFETQFSDSTTDINKVTVDWRFPDTLIKNQVSVTRIIQDSITPVTAFIRKQNGTLIDSNYYEVTALCEPPPSVDIGISDIASNDLSNGKQFAPLFINPKDTGLYTYNWYVDDSLLSHKKIFQYSRAYNLIKLVVDCNGAHCSTQHLIAQIESMPAINATVTGNGDLRIESSYNWENVLMSGFFILLLPFIISIIAYRIILSFKTFLPDIKDAEPGTEGPYKLEFTGQQQNISTEEGIKKLADVLRKRQVSDTYRLNIRKTIRSTIIAGGIPALQFTPLSKPVNFLCFIDKENPDSHLVKLFEYLVDKLDKEEVNIDVYTYYKEPLFLSNEKHNQEHIPLEKIAALYPDTTLFIFGDAQYFLYPLKGIVKNWVTRKLNNWPTKIIITPYTAADWDKKEKLLVESNFVVLPADLSSVNTIDKVVSRQIDIAAQKKERIETSYQARFINFQDLETLNVYLDDQYLSQWVCSLAVYPETNWNFTIAMGKAIEQQLQQDNKPVEIVHYTNLLKLARIVWMQDGIINESLRVQMLASLGKEEEALARKTLSKQLQLIANTVNDDSLVKANFDMHTTLNRFLLDAYYHNKTSKSDEAFIRKAFNNNQLDEGQDIYLEKGENSLLHNQADKSRGIGLSNYFKQISSRQKIYSCVYALGILAVLILSGFTLIKNYSTYLNWSSVKPSMQNYTVTVQGNNFNKEFNLELYYEPTHGVWRSQKINLATTNFTFQYDSVVLQDTSGYGLLKLSTTDRKIITQDSFKLNSTGYTINLLEIEKTPVGIYYKNAANLALADAVNQNLSSNFTISIHNNFNDTTRTTVYYFSRQYEAAANYAAGTLNDMLKTKTIVAQQIDSISMLQKDAQAKVLIFINETAACTPVNATALPKSLYEIWHGGTSNRLININLAKNVIYYSVNDTKTYGTYAIDEICLSTDGVYKITTRTNQGYKLFFIKNVSQQSFDLSVCQNFVRTKTELEGKDESYCDRFNTMSLYYLNNPAVVYLPVSDDNLANAELSKFNTILNNYKNNLADVEVTYVMNEKFTEGEGTSILSKIPNPNDVNTKDSSSNPFQRFYLTFRLKDKPAPTYVPDCSKTFYSIDETKKLASPLIVCKLNLGGLNLTSLPREISTFTNLTELHLGTTSIPEADIIGLQKAMPKCKITYTKNPDVAAIPNIEGNTERNLGRILLNEKGGIESESRLLINAIAKQLATNKQSIVTLKATYSRKQEYAVIQEGLSTITSLLRKEGASTSQIQQSITEQEPQKEKQSKTSYSNFIITVTGKNFPQDFNAQTNIKK